MTSKNSVLLPKTEKDFSKQEFWEKFFQARGTRNFEWYGEYTALCPTLHKYIRARDRLLVVGCGNSTLSADLYDTGHCRQVTSIDTSAVAIRQMTQRHKRRRPDLVFRRMDARHMPDFADGAFTAALDKATLDAVYSSDAQREAAAEMLAEVGRVLAIGGRYVIVSLAQEHILQLLCDTFAAAEPPEWLVRVHVVPQAPDSELQLPVFAFVLTKCVPSARLPRVVEVESPGAERLMRLAGGATELSAWVASLQEAAMLCQSLEPGQEGRVTFENERGEVIYTCFLVEAPSSSRQPYAIFLVPFGQHSLRTLCGPDARRDMAEAASAGRLLAVYLHPRRYYESHAAVQAALSRAVMRYAPRHAALQEADVPFLSCGDVYPSRELTADQCLKVEEVEDWGRRVVDHQGRVLASSVPAGVAADHVLSWLHIGARRRPEGCRILTGGAVPVLPRPRAGLEITYCPDADSDLRPSLVSAMREFVLEEGLQEMEIVPDLDACSGSTFDVVVWCGALSGTDGAPVETLRGLLAPDGLLAVAGHEPGAGAALIEYEVVEAVHGDRATICVWADDTAALLLAAREETKAQTKLAEEEEDEEEEGAKAAPQVETEEKEEEENGTLRDICERLESAGK